MTKPCAEQAGELPVTDNREAGESAALAETAPRDGAARLS